MEVIGTVKRHGHDDPANPSANLTPYRGTKHSMHRKDGMSGDGRGGKVKYEDLGYMYEVSKSSEEKTHYPTLHIQHGKLPELEGSKLGEEVSLAVKAKITGARQTEKGYDWDLEIRSAAITKI